MCIRDRLKETIYAYPPEGVEDPEGLGRIWLLLKSMYGLTQSARNWNHYLEDLFSSLDLELIDEKNYIWANDDYMLGFHVDDIPLAYRNDAALDRFITHFKRHNVKLNDLGLIAQFLGIEVRYDRPLGLLKISQSGYIDEILKRFKMQDCFPRAIPLDPGTKFSRADEPKCDPEEKSLYLEIVGVIGWIANWTAPGLAFTHSYLSRFLASPATTHLQAAKNVLRYIKFIRDKGPIYRRANFSFNMQPNELRSWADSDFAMDCDRYRSTSGHLILLNGAAIYWKSQLQSIAATSTTEAEYISLSDDASMVVGLRMLLLGLSAPQTGPTVIYQDNTATIAASKNPIHRSRLRHINVRVYRIREFVKAQEVLPVVCTTTAMHADMFTKALPAPLLQRHTEVAYGELGSEMLFPPLPAGSA